MHFCGVKKTGYLFFLLLISLQLFANDSDTNRVKVYVNDIVIEGNRKTKEQTVLRLLTFSAGDSIQLSRLMSELDVSRNHLINTGLFYDVTLNLKNWAGRNLDIYVTVVERWYTYPLPILDIYDRNFNNWWVENNHDINRIQYGIRFAQQNVRGRNEDLHITALLGFAQKFNLLYHIPYFDKKQKNGLSLYGSYGQSKILAIQTANNKQKFYENEDDFVRRNWSVGLDWIHQPRFHYKNVFSLSYNEAFITDTIARASPDYFLNGIKEERFIAITYSLSRDYLDIRAYPLKGSYLEVTASKSGIGLFDNNVDIAALTVTYNKYVPLGNGFYFASQNKVKYSLPEKQPYFNQKALGYRSDYVCGYEYYVIDGQQFALTKMNLRYELFKMRMPNPWKKGVVKTDKFPFTFFLKAQVNAAYVNDDYYFRNNPLNNSLLIGYGPGIDILLFYDVSTRIEYSWNRMGESGLYLHVSSFLW